MRIYLIRHGETQWNKLRKYQGSADVPLSEEGAGKLKKADFSPEMVYVTHLIRTQQTAKAIFPDARQEIEDGFREMCFGVFEGRTYEDMENDPDYRSWVDSGCTTRCPGGEDRKEVGDRVEESFDRLMKKAAREGQDELVIVAHGGTQMALLYRFGVPSREYHDWLRPNGCGYLLDGDSWEDKKELRVIKEVTFSI